MIRCGTGIGWQARSTAPHAATLPLRSTGKSRRGPEQPLLQQRLRLGVARRVGPVESAIDHVEKRVAVIVGMVPQNVVCLTVDRAKAAPLQVNQGVQVYRINVEFEVRVIVEYFERNRRDSSRGEQHAGNVVSSRKAVWIDLPRQLQESELLIRPVQEGGGDGAVWHSHKPFIAAKEVHNPGHYRRDCRFQLGIVEHFKRHSQPEHHTGVLIARGPADPGIPRTATVHAIWRLFRVNRGGIG